LHLLEAGEARPPETGPRPDRHLSTLVKAGLVLALIVSAGVVGYFAYGYYQSTLHPSWLFKGAYAQYVGKVTTPTGGSELRTELQVLDYNSSKAEMAYSYNETYTCAPPYHCSPESWNFTEWIDIQAAPTLTLFSFLGATRANPQSTTFSLRNQTYGVTAYKYESQGTLFTVYVYPKVGFPIGYLISSVSEPSQGFDIDITHTNITGLPSIASSTP
jgi:hypothetical protein